MTESDDWAEWDDDDGGIDERLTRPPLAFDPAIVTPEEKQEIRDRLNAFFERYGLFGPARKERWISFVLLTGAKEHTGLRFTAPTSGSVRGGRPKHNSMITLKDGPPGEGEFGLLLKKRDSESNAAYARREAAEQKKAERGGRIERAYSAAVIQKKLSQAKRGRTFDGPGGLGIAWDHVNARDVVMLIARDLLDKDGQDVRRQAEWDNRSVSVSEALFHLR